MNAGVKTRHTIGLCVRVPQLYTLTQRKPEQWSDGCWCWSLSRTKNRRKEREPYERSNKWRANPEGERHKEGRSSGWKEEPGQKNLKIKWHWLEASMPPVKEPATERIIESRKVSPNEKDPLYHCFSHKYVRWTRNIGASSTWLTPYNDIYSWATQKCCTLCHMEVGLSRHIVYNWMQWINTQLCYFGKLIMNHQIFFKLCKI